MESQNKCLWIINQFAGTPVSGWGERHFYLSKHLVKRGYRVVIISSGKNHMFNQTAHMKGLFTMDTYEDIEFCWVNTPNYNPKSFSRFITMFFFAFSLLLLPFNVKRLGKPTHILLSSMSIFPAPIAHWLKNYFKARKFVFEVRDLWPLTPIHLMGFSPNHPMIKLIAWFEKYAYRKADAIVSLLKESESYISGISKMPSKFNYIPNGISEDLLVGKGNINMDLYTAIKSKIPDGKLVIGYTGTIGFANALDEIFKFIAAQEELGNDVFFLVVGDGYESERYKAEVAHCNNVLFINKVPKKDVQTIISLIDVCFISWHHSKLYEYGVSANKYFDYLAAKKPVLSAQTGIIDPVVISGCGLVVKNEADEIRKAVKAFLEMGVYGRQELGLKGYEYVMENHLYSKLGNKYADLLEK